MCNVNSALIDFFFPRKDEVDDQKSELSTLKSKVEDLKEDANKKNEMIGVSVTKWWFVWKYQCMNIHHLRVHVF